MKELIQVRVQYASRQQCCKTHKRPLPLPLSCSRIKLEHNYSLIHLSGLRNAFQDEMVQGEDKEVVLITLKRPLIYIQPMAVDKAILVWLNYKNAYEYWNEQRSNLNKEVLTATQQVSVCLLCFQVYLNIT